MEEVIEYIVESLKKEASLYLKRNVLTSVKNFVKRAEKNKLLTMKFIKKAVKKKKKDFFIWRINERKYFTSVL